MSFIQDLVTLDVVTVTGSLKVQIEDREERVTEDDEQIDGQTLSVINFDELFKRINGTTNTQGDLSIVAATRINLDRDTYNFVANDLGEGGKDLIELHFKSVDMAAKSRSEIVARLMPKMKTKKKGV